MKIGAACGVSPLGLPWATTLVALLWPVVAARLGGHREARAGVYCFGSRSVFRMALLRFRSNASVRPKTSSIASLEFVI